MRTVAAGDGDRSLSAPLTKYNGEEGAPWGRKGVNVQTQLVSGTLSVLCGLSISNRFRIHRGTVWP